MSKNYPHAAYILSLIGGILQLLVVGVPLAILGIISIWGVVCLIWPLIFSILIIIGAMKIKSPGNLDAIRQGSILVLILSILAGNIISLIGGILGLIWKPSAEAPTEVAAPPPPPPPF